MGPLSSDLPASVGFWRIKAVAKHRCDSVAFKPQVADEFIAGETFGGYAMPDRLLMDSRSVNKNGWSRARPAWAGRRWLKAGF